MIKAIIVKLTWFPREHLTLQQVGCVASSAVAHGSPGVAMEPRVLSDRHYTRDALKLERARQRRSCPGLKTPVGIQR